MFVRVHNSRDVRGGNKGSCFTLANYLSKEGKSFFTHNDGEEVDTLEVIDRIDQNKSKLGSEDAKFYMLSINPSHKELCHLLGREVKCNEDLSVEDQQILTGKLQDYTRSCMDEYAKAFGRENVQSGDDLLYYAKIETERRYKFSDKEVQSGKSKIDAIKEGLNWHVHVIVSRKSKDGTTKLSPTVKSRGNEWVNGAGREVKRGFHHTLWKERCGDIFASSYGYKYSTRELPPKRENMRDVALKKVYDKEFREVLNAKIYPSIGQIDSAMQERGWSVHIEGNKHCYKKGDRTCYLPKYRLKAFVAPLSEETLSDILDRFNPRGDDKEVGDGLRLSTHYYTVRGEKRYYSLVCDEKSGVEMPLGKLMKQARDRESLKKSSRGSNRSNSHVPEQASVGTSGAVVQQIQKNATGGIGKAMQKETLEEIRSMKKIVGKTKQAVQMVINPKIALKSLVMSSIRNILSAKDL